MQIIAGSFKNRKIIAPKGFDTRPTSERLRGALFNICQGYINGARFLDLYAGSGAVGLEALSRGASQAIFVDSSKEAVRSIEENIAAFAVRDRARAYCGEVSSLLERLAKQGHLFDIIYADPPYDSEEGLQVIKFLDVSSLLVPNGMVFIEEATEALPEEELQALKTLKNVSTRRLGRSFLWQFQKSK